MAVYVPEHLTDHDRNPTAARLASGAAAKRPPIILPVLSEPIEISDVTRRNIIDELLLTRINPFGRVGELDFLGRVFDLTALPSTDGRYRDMAGDAWQHTVNNSDWSDDWVWSDHRLNIRHGPDVTFLRVVAEMVHPLVRTSEAECEQILEIANRHLRVDGWEITEVARVSGRPVYGGRRLFATPSAVAEAKQLELGEYVAQQITRMEAAIASDPDLAIGTAKEFIETVCRTMLTERAISLPSDDDLPALVRLTVRSLPIVPDEMRINAEAEQIIVTLVNNLASTGRSLAELRNKFGTGHGKAAGHAGLDVSHARLAVGTSTTVAVFLYETHRGI